MENRESFMRLARPKMKGILGLIFSRLLIIVVLMAAQIFLFVVLYGWLAAYVSFFATLQTIFTAGMILYLFNSDMDSSAKLTWMVLIAVFPVAGSVFLLYTQMELGHRILRRRAAELINETKELLAQDEDILAALDTDGAGTDDLHTYLNRSGCFPVYDKTEVRYFPLGEDMFPALLEELEKAERFIFLEFFIIEEGYMWGRILDVLARKVQAGVDVRVLYDGMCEFFHLPHDYPQQLRKLGIQAKMFDPITPFLSTRYNYRDHRKILVVDGRVAFTGGINLADEYINRKERFGHWKDTGLCLRGDAARSFTLLFLQMWNIDEKQADFSLCQTEAPPAPGAAGYVLPYADQPLDSYKVGENVYIDILSHANRYVHIMTPYLILDDELSSALQYAAERGIDVKIILPGVPDKKMAYALAKSHYRALFSAGVKLYEYTPGFVHAKNFVSDDSKAVVGTINLDYRSLYHHFECAAYLYKAPCIAEIEADFQETLMKCRPVTEETIRGEKFRYRLLGGLLKLFAPLM